MTSEELAAIKALADAATPGPWRCVGGVVEIATPAPTKRQPNREWTVPLVLVQETDLHSGEYYAEFGVEDAAFIAAARTAVPALLAEVERLRALVRSAFGEGYDAGGRMMVGMGVKTWPESDARKALGDA